MDDKTYICEYCMKEKTFTNQYNKDVHQSACKAKLQVKKKSPVTFVKNPINSYFKRQCISSPKSSASSLTTALAASSSFNNDYNVEAGVEEASLMDTSSQPHNDATSQPPIDTFPSIPSQAPTATALIDPIPILETDPQINSTKNVKVKCVGFTPKIDGDIYHHFPFQLLSELPIVFEYNVLHHKDCFDNNYSLFDSNISSNKCCSDLLYSRSMKLVVERANKQYNEVTTLNHKYMTYHQLQQKCEQLQIAKRDSELKEVNLSYKNSRLIGTLNMHQRFLAIVSENNIPKLKQLINVALKKKRNLSYIINKITDAVDGIYSPNLSKDDKDLAFLVLKMGGPCLLDILFRAGVLPSVSTAYRMAKSCSPIISSVKSDILDCFKANVNFDKENNLAISLKLDETYVTPSLSYCSRDNSVYGVCYQHGSDIKLTLDNFEDCVRLKENIESNNVHVPRESLVA